MITSPIYMQSHILLYNLQDDYWNIKMSEIHFIFQSILITDIKVKNSGQ